MFKQSLFAGVVCLLSVGAAHAATVSEVPQVGVVQQSQALGAAFGRDIKPARFDAGSQVNEAFDLIREGKQAQAVKLFDRVIAFAEPAEGDSRPRLCRNDKVAEAKGRGQAVLLDGAVCDAHFGKGFALIDLGRGDLAEAELLKATQLAPANAHYANEYAELFKARRQWQESYSLFARAWTIVDKDKTGPDAAVAARALRGMGYNKIELGAFDEAERLFRQSQEYDPGSEAAKAEIGYIARKKAIGS